MTFFTSLDDLKGPFRYNYNTNTRVKHQLKILRIFRFIFYWIMIQFLLIVFQFVEKELTKEVSQKYTSP